MRMLVLALAVAGGPLVAAAGAQTPQSPAVAPQPAAVAPEAQGQILVLQDDNAGETRRRLYEILRQYPPSLMTVLRLDPTLLTSAPYIAPYPALAAFLSQHPEVARNPAFFLGQSSDNRDESRAIRSRRRPKA